MVLLVLVMVLELEQQESRLPERLLALLFYPHLQFSCLKSTDFEQLFNQLVIQVLNCYQFYHSLFDQQSTLPYLQPEPLPLTTL